MRRLSFLAIAAGVAAMLYWALAQPAPQPMARLFPSGALLYVEAKDFNALLGDWNGSAEKRDWLASVNYDVFSRSQLFLKLGNAQSEFATAAGVPADYAMLTSIAGSNSALAIYDLGKLEFLYITHLPSARALSTALWKARATYQTRHAGAFDYFVKEDKSTHRLAAFAYAGDTLALATREDLIAGALQLMARDSVPSVASEPWFTQSIEASGANQGDLRLIYNMTALLRAPQFRSHWIQRNSPDLRQFSAGLTDLDRSSAEIRERRILLRASSEPAVSDEGPAGQLLASIPDDAGSYRVLLHPTAAQATDWIEDKLFPHTAAAPPDSRFAPGVEETQNAGTELDLETRIDQRPLAQNRDYLRPLRDRLNQAKIDAILEISSTRVDADRVYVEPHSAIVLLAAAAWNSDQMQNALGASAEALWSNSSAATWRTGAGGIRELEGLGQLSIAIDGKWLIISDSAEMVNSVFGRRNRTAIAGAAYAAGWRQAREFPNYERMMTLIDFPNHSSEPGAPAFFSADLASLGRALKRLDQTTIVMHDQGTMLRESVVYKLNP